MLESIGLNGETTCLVIEGAAHGAIFRAHVTEVLAPTLQVGDIVICDNLAAHYNCQARQVIDACGGRLLFLPAYSADLNPIELMRAKVKAHLRAAKARTPKALRASIKTALNSISTSDATGFFRHTGYMCTIN